MQLALQEEKLKLEEEALYNAKREAARAAKQKKILEVRGSGAPFYYRQSLYMCYLLNYFYF